MNEAEFPHEEGDEEVQFRDDDPITETTPPTPITSHDMEVIIKGWEVKFEQILRCLREVQLASEKANSDMFGMSREGRAREDQQERRIEAMYVGLTEFIEKCDPRAPHKFTPPRRAHGEHAVHAIDAHRATIQAAPGIWIPTIPCGPGRANRDCAQHGFAHPGTQRHWGHAHPRSRRHSGHAHPGSRRHSGHAHPRSQRCKGHAHPRSSRRQRSEQRSTIQRTTNTRGR